MNSDFESQSYYYREIEKKLANGKVNDILVQQFVEEGDYEEALLISAENGYINIIQYLISIDKDGIEDIIAEESELILIEAAYGEHLDIIRYISNYIHDEDIEIVVEAVIKTLKKYGFNNIKILNYLTKIMKNRITDNYPNNNSANQKDDKLLPFFQSMGNQHYFQNYADQSGWIAFTKKQFPDMCISDDPLVYNAENGDIIYLSNNSFFKKDFKSAKEYIIRNTDIFLKKELLKCKYRFLINMLLIKNEGGRDHHANGLIFDNKSRIMYRFEPNGGSFYINEDIDNDFSMLAAYIGYAYKGPPDWCPEKGTQQKETLGKDLYKRKGEPGGYCMVWSLMFLHYRMQYPNKTMNEIYDIMDDNPLKLSRKIRGYANFLHEENMKTPLKNVFLDKEIKKYRNARLSKLYSKTYEVLYDFIDELDYIKRHNYNYPTEKKFREMYKMAIDLEDISAKLLIQEYYFSAFRSFI